MAKEIKFDKDFDFESLDGFALENFGKKRKKHGNQPVRIKNYNFDSKKEGEYFLLLLHQLERGKIDNFTIKKKYDLIPTQRDENGKCIFNKMYYESDFVVFYDGKEEVIDVKGRKTQVYNLKKKLMYYVHGILIKEV